MKRYGKDFASMPLWMRELHAWRSGRPKVSCTLPSRVLRDLSLLPEDMTPRGLAALHGDAIRVDVGREVKNAT